MWIVYAFGTLRVKIACNKIKPAKTLLMMNTTKIMTTMVDNDDANNDDGDDKDSLLWQRSWITMQVQRLVTTECLLSSTVAFGYLMVIHHHWKSFLFFYVELHGGHAKFYQSFQPI